MVSARCPRGRPAPSPDPWAGEEGGWPEGSSSGVPDLGPHPHARLQLLRRDPYPQAGTAGRRDVCGAPGRTTQGGVPTEGVAWDPICTLERVATLVSVPRAGW